MSIRTTRENPTRREIARHAQALPIAAFLVTVALAGCGSDGGSALDEFIGAWVIDPAASTFDLTCPAPNADLNGDVPLWNGIILERGTLTDLVDFGGPCPVALNVSGKIASVANPDPFTGAPALCRIDIGNTPGTIFADITSAWEFNLRMPEKGKAPAAQMLDLVSPVSGLTIVHVDSNLVETPDPPCTYMPHANLTKLAQY